MSRGVKYYAATMGVDDRNELPGGAGSVPGYCGVRWGVADGPERPRQPEGRFRDGDCRRDEQPDGTLGPGMRTRRGGKGPPE